LDEYISSNVTEVKNMSEGGMGRVKRVSGVVKVYILASLLENAS
jgi:hypothetical protein